MNHRRRTDANILAEAYMSILKEETAPEVEMHEVGDERGAKVFKVVIGQRYVALVNVFNGTYTLITKPSINYPDLHAQFQDPNQPLDQKYDGYQTKDIEKLKNLITTEVSKVSRPMHNSPSKGGPGGY